MENTKRKISIETIGSTLMLILKKFIYLIYITIIWILKLLLNFVIFIWKLPLYKKASYLIILNALFQLWFSTEHIEAINSLFISDIGVYLFGFILFGLVSFFSATRTRTLLYKIISVLSCWVASAFGIIYMMMAKGDTKTPYSEIEQAMNLAIAGVSIYLLASVLLIISMILNERD